MLDLLPLIWCMKHAVSKSVYDTMGDAMCWAYFLGRVFCLDIKIAIELFFYESLLKPQKWLSFYRTSAKAFHLSNSTEVEEPRWSKSLMYGRSSLVVGLFILTLLGEPTCGHLA
ncbi:hypothetical protein GOP47_0009049 [Adiantum capillus-veneris]|uniref:Uncharacterized protein n=1 Tax=Adiantum capillus-veneris TaxID=13818 RepID=A0A9D4UZR7_ADICA|nr:hypothetical protein GOP47_0009049 [Adiantum capillus-veneris]